MMDEIESLARTREAMNQEPTDSIRIVNSLLVGLDSLKQKQGFFCFMTSNVMNMLDDAVLDRCDLRMKLEAPTWKVRFISLSRHQILYRDVQRLVEAGLLIDDGCELVLEQLCKNMKTISGRFLSKLCLLTYSFYVIEPVAGTEFVEYMEKYMDEVLDGLKY